MPVLSAFGIVEFDRDLSFRDPVGREDDHAVSAVPIQLGGSVLLQVRLDSAPRQAAGATTVLEILGCHFRPMWAPLRTPTRNATTGSIAAKP